MYLAYLRVYVSNIFFSSSIMKPGSVPLWASLQQLVRSGLCDASLSLSRGPINIDQLWNMSLIPLFLSLTRGIKLK